MIQLCKEGAKGIQVNNMVIPFAYDFNIKLQPFERYIGNLCNDNQRKWRPISIKEINNELYEHILSLVADDITNDTNDIDNSEVSNHIAQALSMDKSSAFYPNFQLTCKGLPSNLTFCISNIILILFKSGIGFLVLKMDYSEFDNMEQVILANNQMRYIRHSEIYKVETTNIFLKMDQIIFDHEDSVYCYHVIDDTDNKKIKLINRESIPIQDSSIKEIKIIYKGNQKALKIRYNHAYEEALDYKQFIHDIVSELNVSTFFNQSFSKNLNRQMCNKATVFSALTIKYEQQEAKEISQSFFRLRKGYSTTYFPDEIEYSDNNYEVFKPFNDSYWGVSREGCANLTYDSNEFMKYGYISRVTTYFYLYIIALHQYYGMLKSAKDISYLPPILDECIDDIVFNKLLSIRNECNFFYLKAVFEEVSHITHQAEYYNRLISVLGIKNMQQELNYELDRIAVIVEQVKEIELEKQEEKKRETEKNKEKQKAEDKEKEESRNEQKNRWFSTLAIIFSLFSITSIMDATLSFWKNIAEIDHRYKSYEVINSFIMEGIILAVCIVFIIGYAIYKKAGKDKLGKPKSKLS